MTVTVKVPVIVYVCIPVVPVVPSPKFQANVYGWVPPDAVAVKVTEVPVVVLLGPLIAEIDRASGEMLTIWKAVATAPLWSYTVSEMVYVPFVEKLVENEAAVPLAGLPPVADQL
jgi:hypothetical protein